MKKEFDINSFPFGKHMCQPLDIVMADEQYSKWLCRQGWFSKQFPEYFARMNKYNIEHKPEPESFYKIYDMKFGSKKDVVAFVKQIKQKYLDKPMSGYDLLFIKHFYSGYANLQPEDILEVYVYNTSKTNTSFKLVVWDKNKLQHISASMYDQLNRLDYFNQSTAYQNFKKEKYGK